MSLSKSVTPLKMLGPDVYDTKFPNDELNLNDCAVAGSCPVVPVSYTHLTLPTIE